VTLQAGCEILNSTISGPAIVGERTIVRDAYIARSRRSDRTAASRGARSPVSVVMENTQIEDIDHRLENSLNRPQRRAAQ